MRHKPEDEVIKIVIERVDPNVRGGGGFGLSGYLDGQYADGFQGFVNATDAVDHAIRALKRYKQELKKHPPLNGREAALKQAT